LDPHSNFSIPVTQGVPQGSPCSPLLFNILIDPIIRHLLKINPSVLLELFADDTTLMANNYSLIAQSLQLVEKAFQTVGLQVNRAKSALLYLDPDRPPPYQKTGQTVHWFPGSNTLGSG
jgi:hypothetical protein